MDNTLRKRIELVNSEIGKLTHWNVISGKSLSAYVQALKEHSSRQMLIDQSFSNRDDIDTEVRIPIYDSYDELRDWIGGEIEAIQNTHKLLSIFSIDDKELLIIITKNAVHLFDSKVENTTYDKELLKVLVDVAQYHKYMIYPHNYSSNIEGVTRLMMKLEDVIGGNDDININNNSLEDSIIRFSSGIAHRIIELADLAQYFDKYSKINAVDIIWWTIRYKGF